MKQDTNSTVELKVPVDGDYVSVVRLLISGLANRLRLPVEELENLKLVIGEAFLSIVEKSRTAAGLVNLRWRQNEHHITVSITDPAGQHQSVTKTASLALLSQLGGRYETQVTDGVARLDLNFDIKYKEDRPFIFGDQPDGEA